MKKIIQIKLVDDSVLRITFQLTTSCTYACRYCPDRLHEGQHQKINLDNLKIFLNKFKERKVTLILTGGEVTTHPQFVDVLKLAKELNIPVSVDTNCVRTKRFFEEVAPLVPAWCITLHPSEHVLDLEKIKVLTPHSFVLVAVAMDPDYWETSVDWYRQVCAIENVKAVPIKLEEHTSAKLNYTDDQLQFLIDNPGKLTMTDQRYNELLNTHQFLLDMDSYSTFDDGTIEKTNPYDMFKEGTNKFFGWSCYAGNDSILLFPDGKVGWANCGIKTYDNYLDLDPEELKKPLKCTFISCTCGTDVRSTKTK